MVAAQAPPLTQVQAAAAGGGCAVQRTPEHIARPFPPAGLERRAHQQPADIKAPGSKQAEPAAVARGDQSVSRSLSGAWVAVLGTGLSQRP